MDNASGTGKSPLPSSTDLAILPEPGSPGPVWGVLAERAAHYATSARGGGTRRTYRSAWIRFSAWCASLGRDPLSGDADLVAMYVVRRPDDGLAVSSIRVRCPTRRSSGWSSKPWRRPDSIRRSIPDTRCARGAPPPPAIKAPAWPISCGRPGTNPPTSHSVISARRTSGAITSPRVCSPGAAARVAARMDDVCFSPISARAYGAD